MNKINWIAAQPLIGGMPIGFENAFGSQPLAIITAGFKNDEHYIKYMNETRGIGVPVIHMNTDYETFSTEEDASLYNKIVSNNEIDVLMHVAICAGLSQLNCVSTGCKARGDANNDQNQNMYALTKLGMRMNAKVVVFENAPAAYTKSGESTVNKLKEIATEYKYSTHLFRTDTLLHGIPQSRKRTFIMFYRDTNPAYFNYELIPYIKLDEYLKQVDESMDHYNDFMCIQAKDCFYEFILNYSGCSFFHDAMKKIGSHKNTWTALQLTEYIGFETAITFFEQQFKETKKSKYEKAIEISKHCMNKISRGLGYWDSSTYLPNGGEYTNAVISKNIHRALHPTLERGYNIREILHLMGHPHDFVMANPQKDWIHITQNVPVKTAQFIGLQIKLYLEEKLGIIRSDFLKQDNITQTFERI